VHSSPGEQRAHRGPRAAAGVRPGALLQRAGRAGGHREVPRHRAGRPHADRQAGQVRRPPAPLAHAAGFVARLGAACLRLGARVQSHRVAARTGVCPPRAEGLVLCAARGRARLGSTMLRLTRRTRPVARELDAGTAARVLVPNTCKTPHHRMRARTQVRVGGNAGARAGTSSARVRPPIEAPAGLATEPRTGMRRRPGGAGGRGKGVSSARGGNDSFALWRGGCLPTDGHWEARSYRRIFAGPRLAPRLRTHTPCLFSADNERLWHAC
jgi:hypothetical protein